MAPGSSSSKVSRKRASSDQLREQANRNVRPAKGKLMNKNRLESSGSSVQRPSSPPLPGPATDNLDDDSGDNSEYEQLELEPTDVDDENMDWGEEEKQRTTALWETTGQVRRDIIAMPERSRSLHRLPPHYA